MSFHSRSRRALPVALASVLALTSMPVGAAPSDASRRIEAARFIGRAQEKDGSIPSFSAVAGTADAVMALSALGYAPKRVSRALGYLRTKVSKGEVEVLGETAKIVLAVKAAGGKANDFGGVNLLDSIRDTLQSDGRYASLQESQVFDQALAILALRSVGAHVPRKAMRWLADAQCENGGWQFDEPAGPSDDENCNSGAGDFNNSDSNTTALAMMAFHARPSTVPLARDPVDFFALVRDEIKGGWVFDPVFRCDDVPAEGEFCYLTDANSTALVLQALRAEGVPRPSAGVQALRALQYNPSKDACLENGGAFAFTWEMTPNGLRRTDPNIGATVGGAMGLHGQPLPLEANELRALPPRGCA